MSQVELAAPEISSSYLSLIECGLRYPTPRVLEILAGKLGCAVSFLLTGVGEDMHTELRSSVAYAWIALDNGEADVAADRFGAVLGRPDLAGLPELERDARWGCALALEATGDLAAALTELGRLVVDLSCADDPERWAAVHLALCRCHRDRGDLELAIIVGQQGLTALTGLGRPWTDAMVTLGATLLAAHLHHGDVVYARCLADRLIVEGNRVGTHTARMAAAWNAALVAEACGDYVGALGLIERAVALLGETNDSRNLGRARVAHAGCLLRAAPGQAERVSDMLDRAESELAGSSAGPVDLADCRIEQARAASRLGRPDGAADRARHAIELLAGIDTDGAVLADAHIVLGEACAGLGRHEEAIDSLTTAVGYLERMGSARLAARVWADLAAVCNTIGDDGGEAVALRRALDCAGMPARAGVQPTS